MSATRAARTAGRPTAVLIAPGERYVYMDVARILAILAVVVIHVMSLVPAVVPRGSGRWWLGLTGNAAARWSVPVFVMLSGALLLDPVRQEPLRQFYRRRLARVGIPAVVWIVLYYVFRVLAHHERLRPVQVGRELLRMQTYYHLYFLYIILGLYLVTPFLRSFIATVSRTELSAATAVALLLATANDVLEHTVHISSPTYALTAFLPYLGYFLAGYLLRDVRVSTRTGWLLVGAFVVAVAAEVTLSVLLTGRYGIRMLQVPMSYLAPLTVVMALSVFLLLARWGDAAATTAAGRRRLHVIAAATFGVYLAHPMLLDRLYYLLDLTRNRASAAALVGLVLATAVLTWLAVLVVQRIPVLRRLV